MRSIKAGACALALTIATAGGAQAGFLSSAFPNELKFSVGSPTNSFWAAAGALTAFHIANCFLRYGAGPFSCGRS